jgi:ArsR family transcriptional regulator
MVASGSRARFGSSYRGVEELLADAHAERSCYRRLVDRWLVVVPPAAARSDERWSRKVGTFDPVRPDSRAAHTEQVDISTGLVSTAVESAGLLAVVADPVRWRLLAHLADGATRCVCDLQPVAGVAANLLSYHLKVLREASLVQVTRRGRWMDYAIAADALDRLRAALPAAGADAMTGTPSACPPVSPSASTRRKASLSMTGGSR